MAQATDPESSGPATQDETDYLLSSPAMRARLLNSMETHRASEARRLRDLESRLVERVNEVGKPIELHSYSGARAWIVPEDSWSESPVRASDPDT